MLKGIYIYITTENRDSHKTDVVESKTNPARKQNTRKEGVLMGQIAEVPVGGL